MSKEKKTNVMRILDKAKIPYIARSYEYKESNLSGTHAAAALGSVSYTHLTLPTT